MLRVLHGCRIILVLSLSLLILASTGCGRSRRVVDPNARKEPRQLTWTTDNVEAIRLNAKACALIDRYDSGREEAIKLLRRAVELAPNWLPARINLAIALLNQNKPEPLAEAEQILREILEQRDDVPHAHFCLGIILNHRGEKEEAARHFRRVTELDPSDAFAWYWLGDCLRLDSPDEAEQCFRKALERNPYLRAANYGLQQVLSLKGRTEEALEIMKQRQRLEAIKADQKAGVIYDEMGPYAYAIGAVPPVVKPGAEPPLYAPWSDLSVRLREGVRWVNAGDFQTSPLSRALWDLYSTTGIPWAVFDYDNDNDPDILLAGAVWTGQGPGNVLLRNDGNGKFTDVTVEAGLDFTGLPLAIAVGDYDNDLRPDLYICNAGPNLLLHNEGSVFRSVTLSVDLSGGDLVSTGAVFVDLDQDADLDIFVTNLCPTSELPDVLQQPDRAPSVSSLVFLNTGRPGVVPQDPASTSSHAGPSGLSTSFQEHTSPPLCYNGPATAVTYCDLDNDRDVDLLLVTPQGRVVMLVNERALAFQTVELAQVSTAPHVRGGILTVDFDVNDIRDLVLSGGEDSGIIFVGKGERKLTDYPNSIYDLAWDRLTAQVGPIVQPRALDINLDGTWDVLALAGGRPLWIALGPKDVVQIREGALPDLTGPGSAPPISLLADDFTGNGIPELLAFVPGAGLVGAKAEGNGNHWIKLRFTGVRNDGEELRTTADAVGTRYLVHAGGITVIDEIRPLASGGAAVHGPVVVGLESATEVDGLRIRWPDNMIQGEVGLAANQLHVIQEIRRKTLSCPILFTWNGERFEYVCDFLGGGGLGYLLRPGVYNPPDPDEVLRITPSQLRPVDGRLRIAIAEPMDEVCYLDALELIAIDHPEGTLVFPDERFAPPENRATGVPLCFSKTIRPRHAVDHHGHDVTDRLQRMDRRAVDDFRLLATWPGYAEPHHVELSFDVPPLKDEERLFLCLGGWVEYAFSDTNYAAYTAGVELKLPAIDVELADGQWHEVIPVAGIPAGSPRTMTVEITGRVPTGGPLRLRVRTNAQVYWDEAFLAVAPPSVSYREVTLKPIESTLLYRGHLVEYSPDGRWPTEFDYARTDPTPLVRQYGSYTRYGPVNELLEAEDDAMVIFGAGDALEVDFDARDLPPLRDGWTRTYLLRAVGFCKSADPLTLHPMTVEPLPFRGMRQYPPAPDEKPADPERVRRLHEKYNTRYHGPRGNALSAATTAR